MTKHEVLFLDTMLQHFQVNGDQKLLEPFKYLIVKNRFLFKNVLAERTDIVKALLKDKDVEQDKQSEYLLSIPEFQEFLQEQVDIDLYQLHVDKLEGKDFDTKIAYDLVNHGFITDEIS